MLSDTKDNYVFKNSLYMCFLTLFTKHLKKKIFYFWLSSFYFLIFNFYNRFIMNFIRETDVRQVIRDALVLLFTVQTYIFCTILELDSNEHPMVRLTNCLQMKLYVTPTTVFHCTCACHYFNTIFSSYDQPWEPGLAKSVAHERWTNTHGQLWLRP